MLFHPGICAATFKFTRPPFLQYFVFPETVLYHHMKFTLRGDRHNQSCVLSKAFKQVTIFDLCLPGGNSLYLSLRMSYKISLHVLYLFL